MTDFGEFWTCDVAADWIPTSGFTPGGHRAWKSSSPVFPRFPTRGRRMSVTVEVAYRRFPTRVADRRADLGIGRRRLATCRADIGAGPSCRMSHRLHDTAPSQPLGGQDDDVRPSFRDGASRRELLHAAIEQAPAISITHRSDWLRTLWRVDQHERIAQHTTHGDSEAVKGHGTHDYHYVLFMFSRRGRPSRMPSPQGNVRSTAS